MKWYFEISVDDYYDPDERLNQDCKFDVRCLGTNYSHAMRTKDCEAMLLEYDIPVYVTHGKSMEEQKVACAEYINNILDELYKPVEEENRQHIVSHDALFNLYRHEVKVLCSQKCEDRKSKSDRFFPF